MKDFIDIYTRLSRIMENYRIGNLSKENAIYELDHLNVIAKEMGYKISISTTIIEDIYKYDDEHPFEEDSVDDDD